MMSMINEIKMEPSDESEMELSDSASPTNVQMAEESSLNHLPVKSKERYECTYSQFMNWCQKQDITTSLSEQILLTYFNEQSKKISPNSLWTIYSMLRSTLSVHQHLDISQYKKLKAFLKRTSDGYKPKKAKTLTSEEIHKFLNEAPDSKYLLSKVILIFGISGACRKHELSQLKVDSITDLGSAVIIKIPDSKTKQLRICTITGKFYDIYKKYCAVRPPIVNQNRFFLNYQAQKCTRQPVGINKIANVPKQIAMYLRLKEPELYTGHCFRRLSPSILVDAGADISTTNQQDESENTDAAESYTEEIIPNEVELPNPVDNSVFHEEVDIKPEMIDIPESRVVYENSVTEYTISDKIPVNFYNCSNNTINIKIIHEIKK